MVKKKRLRHQQEPADQNGGDSTESCDENQINAAEEGKSCPHVTKAVDLGKVKKALKNGGLAHECPECKKNPCSSVPTEEQLESSNAIWLCLKCGHQGCGRTRQSHALKHHHVPHSDCHSLATDTQDFNIWCYECDVEVAAACRKKLHECIKYLKQQDCSSSVVNSNNVAQVPEEEEKVTTKPSLRSASPKKRVGAQSRVRGLRNLGNTCYFNSVLQCLAQTPFLLEGLFDMNEAGRAFELPGDGDELPILKGELAKWGSLTEQLANTLSELRDIGGVLDPSQLLHKLKQKCPQFDGRDQHDSHELLRHLLEEVRSEDLKRYQSVILHSFGYTPRVDPNSIETNIRVKARKYGRQASEQILHPEQVFRGQLASTIECQECFHSSQRVESFMELSLPVTVNKPQPPVLRRKTGCDETFDLCESSCREQPSKHQLKKERKQARKSRKKQKQHPETESVVKDENSNRSKAGESEQSDADVEDNIEQELGQKERTKDVGESGYSSEKAGNEELALDSPVYHTVNGDSALSSPDFPHSKEATCAEFDAFVAVDSEKETSKQELSVAIPVLTNRPLALGSPVSNHETPSPVSSEVNIECLITASPQLNGDGTSPVSDLERPISRFSFHHPDEEPVKCNELQAVEVAMKELTLSADTERMCNGDVNNTAAGDAVDRCITLAPRFHCKDDGCSLASCLNQFTMVELMTGTNRVVCDNCTSHFGKEGKSVCTNSTKQLLVSNPPAVLVLHLKRFELLEMKLRKISRHVTFPLVLDLAPFCAIKCRELPTLAPNQTKVLYALFGVVEHSGTLHGGHYISYVKVRSPLPSDDPRRCFLPTHERRKVVEDGCEAAGGAIEPPEGKWYKISDEHVSEVAEKQVLLSQAYMLFYERIW